MKLTEKQLKQIIKEEARKLREGLYEMGSYGADQIVRKLDDLLSEFQTHAKNATDAGDKAFARKLKSFANTVEGLRDQARQAFGLADEDVDDEIYTRDPRR